MEFFMRFTRFGALKIDQFNIINKFDQRKLRFPRSGCVVKQYIEFITPQSFIE